MPKNKKKHTIQQDEEPLMQQAEEPEVNEQDEPVDPDVTMVDQPDEVADGEQVDSAEDAIEKMQAELAEQKRQYLFLAADFDNYRKRTLKEKQDLVKNGAERALKDLLPIVDDFERAVDAINKAGDVDSLREGVDLIFNKFKKYLEQNNVTPIESTGQDFDPDLHEAVTMFPAPDESQRGKVIDTTQRGYMLNDKVLRHAKVVVGQ